MSGEGSMGVPDIRGILKREVEGKEGEGRRSVWRVMTDPDT